MPVKSGTKKVHAENIPAFQKWLWFLFDLKNDSGIKPRKFSDPYVCYSCCGFKKS